MVFKCNDTVHSAEHSLRRSAVPQNHGRPTKCGKRTLVVLIILNLNLNHIIFLPIIIIMFLAVVIICLIMILVLRDHHN